jgi:hypothetical protein
MNAMFSFAMVFFIHYYLFILFLCFILLRCSIPFSVAGLPSRLFIFVLFMYRMSEKLIHSVCVRRPHNPAVHTYHTQYDSVYSKAFQL